MFRVTGYDSSNFISNNLRKKFCVLSSLFLIRKGGTEEEEEGRKVRKERRKVKKGREEDIITMSFIEMVLASSLGFFLNLRSLFKDSYRNMHQLLLHYCDKTSLAVS